MAQARHDSAVMTVAIRDANETDYAAMCELHFKAIMSIPTTHYANELKSSWAADLAPEGYAKGKADGELYRVATDGDASVCGFSSIIDERLYALYVHPQTQGKGIGVLLLNDCEKNLSERGVKTAHVRASLNGEAFYAAHGWEKYATDTFRSRGNLELKVVKMQKVLTL